jgi:2-keto-4-pentenoate hydratase/2-oxohepta-3-ene-1,7-dioic acid hydratase in catechol pathway
VIRFARLGDPGAEIPIADDDGTAYDLRPLTADIDGAFLATHTTSTVRSAISARALPELDGVGGRRFGPPIARPAAIIGVGMNYAAHAAESGSPPPVEPIMFLKHPNTIAGPDDDVRIPPGSSATDWEVELGVVIGSACYRLPSDAAARAGIAGYVLANDVSERHHQLEISGGQWSKGKCAPGFTPLGPWLLPRDEIASASFPLRSWVGGEARQASSTDDMIFGVETLVRELSHYVRLDPGDLILTGTPEGVALSGRFDYLRPGDVVELDGGPLGHQRQIFVEGADA